ncbi:MAG: hypothetical protein ACOY0T_18195 [Myxococcota bacterium]
MKSWRLLAIVVVTACGNTKGGTTKTGDPDASAPRTWQQVLTDLSRSDGSSSAFSISYAGTIEGTELVTQRWLQAIEWADATTTACADFESSLGTAGAKAAARWFLQVETTQTTPGVYEIVPSINTELTALRANVFLKQAADNKELIRHTALAGHVTLSAAPQSEEDWHAGIGMSALVEAEFPEVSATERGCEIGGSVNGTPPPPHCKCAAADGTSFECDRTGEFSCCHDFNAPRVAFKASFSAQRCASMCTATSTLLLGRCQSLKEP